MRTLNVEPPADHSVRDGLSYALFLPPGTPRGGVVILPGAGSAKEGHFAYARALRAAGIAAVAFDQRGHGESDGELGAGALDDVATMATVLPAGPVALRGSSMGGYLAIVAAERIGAVAVVAICPAPARGLIRGLRAGRLRFRADHPALEALLAAHDETQAAARLGDRLLLQHAEGDESVPVELSRELHAAAPGSRLVVVPGGHHSSVQHDPELQALSVRFIARRLAAGTGPGIAS